MDPDLQLRLEYPFGLGSCTSLDILLRTDAALAGLELKYLCRATDVSVADERFCLSHQKGP